MKTSLIVRHVRCAAPREQALGGNRVEAKRHLEVALNELVTARRDLEGAKHASTADIFMPREHHGLLHRREGVFGKALELKEHQGLKKAQKHVEVGQHETDAAERLCPDLPLMCDGQRLKSGSFVGMLVFNGFLAEVHYRPMITKNIHEVDRQMMAVKYALQWCITVVVAVPPRPAGILCAHRRSCRIRCRRTPSCCRRGTRRKPCGSKATFGSCVERAHDGSPGFGGCKTRKHCRHIHAS
jgi:hypothetical protein